MASLGPRLRRLLSRPRAAPLVVAASLALMLPSLDTGLAADDYIHMMMARGESTIEGFAREPLDLFRFASPRLTPLLMRDGVVSWWADPSAELAFFRPISALTHVVDYRLWPDAPWVMHLHSGLWALLALTGVLALYRRLLSPGWGVALATALYALDDGRAWFVSWVAARNAVVATALSVWVLYWYDRGRHGSWRARVLALVLYTLALLAGEGSIAVCAYLLAHALFLDRASLRDRGWALAPFAALTLIWRVTYHALGYGVRGSGLYFDPLGQPFGFAKALLERAPILLLSQLGGPWSDAYTALYPFPALLRAWWIVALCVLALLAYALTPLWRDDASFRFGTVGALLSTVPACAVFPADRMLSWIAIGASIALARAGTRLVDAPEAFVPASRRRIALPLLRAVLASSLVLGPLLLPSRARGNLVMRQALDRAQASIPTAASIATRFVIYLNAPATPMAGYVPIERAARGVPRPARQYWLSAGVAPVAVTRVDERALRVAPEGGFAGDPQSWLLRDPRRRFRIGQRVQLAGLRVEVERLTAEGRPAVVLARFDRALEDPRYLWLRWDRDAYVPLAPPRVGETLELPRVGYLRMILGPPSRW